MFTFVTIIIMIAVSSPKLAKTFLFSEGRSEMENKLSSLDNIESEKVSALPGTDRRPCASNK